MPSKRDTLTIFTVPRRFDEGEHVMRQINALESWTRLEPRPEIMLLGDDPGVAGAAQKFGCVHVSGVHCDGRGVPLLSSAFAHVNWRASSDLVAFVNTDIILFQDLIIAMKVVDKEFDEFLMVGRRRVIDITKPLEFSEGWESRLRRRVETSGNLDDASAMDYFVFKRNMLHKIGMLSFSVGSPGWDNWLMASIIERGIPTIDATHDVFCIHHYHRKTWPSYGIERNRRLARGKSGTIIASVYKLRDGEILPRHPVVKSPPVIKPSTPPPVIKPIKAPPVIRAFHPKKVRWAQGGQRVRNYCTYFDSEYFVRFLAMYESMIKWCKPFKLWVIAFDKAVLDKLKRLREVTAPNNLCGLNIISISVISNQNTRELWRRRDYKEYIRTFKPLVMQYILKQDLDNITYLDSGGYFFAQPDGLYEEIAAVDIAITSHRFGAEHIDRVRTVGEFNTDFMYLRKGKQETSDCIAKWCDQTMAHCKRSPREGYFFEQKYLDEWPKRWGAHVVQHKGVNLAPWNQSVYSYTAHNGYFYVDDDPLIWYHFHQGLSPNYRLDPLLQDIIYEKYRRALRRSKEVINGLR